MDDRQPQDVDSDAQYEPPRAEDVTTDDAPSVTAAGKTLFTK
jgi:hypothetical protein